MTVLKTTKYLIFTEVDNTGKTKKVAVENKSKEFLGTIKWIAGWRKYGFHPANMIQFDVSCLKDIIDFIEELMSERKTVKTDLPGLENQDIIVASPLMIKDITF